LRTRHRIERIHLARYRCLARISKTVPDHQLEDAERTASHDARLSGLAHRPIATGTCRSEQRSQQAGCEPLHQARLAGTAGDDSASWDTVHRCDPGRRSIGQSLLMAAPTSRNSNSTHQLEHELVSSTAGRPTLVTTTARLPNRSEGGDDLRHQFAGLSRILTNPDAGILQRFHLRCGGALPA